MSPDDYNYRNKNFAIEIIPARSEPGFIDLRITTNGTQWQSLTISSPEAERIVYALRTYLDESERPAKT